MYGNRYYRKPPPPEKRRTLKLRGGPVANPTLTLHQSPARNHPSRCTQRRCECFIRVNAMSWRECHPVTAESNTPVLVPAFLNLGLHNPSRDHNREGQASSISSPKRDPYSFPARPQTGDQCTHRHPTGRPCVRRYSPQPVLRRPPRGASQMTCCSPIAPQRWSRRAGAGESLRGHGWRAASRPWCATRHERC